MKAYEIGGAKFKLAKMTLRKWKRANQLLGEFSGDGMNDDEYAKNLSSKIYELIREEEQFIELMKMASEPIEPSDSEIDYFDCEIHVFAELIHDFFLQLGGSAKSTTA